MINIINRQRKILFNEKKFKSDTKKVLEHLDYGDFDISFLFTTNKTIAKYNSNYRKKNKPTDILSFQFHTDLKPGEKITPKSKDEKNLGDIIISLEHVKADSDKENHSIDDHLKILLIHGICHLLGHDHEEESGFNLMYNKEIELLDVIE